MPDRFPAGMHRRIGPRLFVGRFSRRRLCFCRQRCSLLVTVLQQRQFRQRFLYFPFFRRPRIALQEIFISLLRQRRIAQLVPPQLRHPQNRILAIMARRIFVHQELVGIHGRLIVASPKPVAHLRIHFRDRQQRIRHFGRARGNQRDASITGNHLLVIGQGALLRRLAVQRSALFFRARELRAGRLPPHRSGGISSFRAVSRRGRWRNAQCHRHRYENRRNMGEAPAQNFFTRKHQTTSPKRNLHITSTRQARCKTSCFRGAKYNARN